MLDAVDFATSSTRKEAQNRACCSQPEERWSEHASMKVSSLCASTQLACSVFSSCCISRSGATLWLKCVRQFHLSKPLSGFSPDDPSSLNTSHSAAGPNQSAAFLNTQETSVCAANLQFVIWIKKIKNLETLCFISSVFPRLPPERAALLCGH